MPEASSPPTDGVHLELMGASAADGRRLQPHGPTTGTMAKGQGQEAKAPVRRTPTRPSCPTRRRACHPALSFDRADSDPPAVCRFYREADRESSIL